MCQACRSRRLLDTGQAVRVGGTYVTCRHLFCAGPQAERGLTPSGRGTSASADIAVTAISVPAVRIVGLYTILPLPIVCGVYYKNGGSGGNIVLRNRVGDDRVVGCLNEG